VRWEVAEGNMADANKYVTRAVASTNEAFRALQDRRARERDERLQRTAAEEAHKAELQRQLDALE
jgi:hypothetical protein